MIILLQSIFPSPRLYAPGGVWTSGWPGQGALVRGPSVLFKVVPWPDQVPPLLQWNYPCYWHWLTSSPKGCNLLNPVGQRLSLQFLSDPYCTVVPLRLSLLLTLSKHVSKLNVIFKPGGSKAITSVSIRLPLTGTLQILGFPSFWPPHDQHL